MEHAPQASTIDRRLPVAELPQYLTVDELMRYMSIGRSSAYAFAREHGVRIGRLVRIPREALR
jgi:excisionase family DNA binding protein